MYFKIYLKKFQSNITTAKIHTSLKRKYFLFLSSSESDKKMHDKYMRNIYKRKKKYPPKLPVACEDLFGGVTV